MKGKIFQKAIYSSTNTKVANTLVKRDSAGNFTAGTIAGALNGNASTATKLQTSRKIYITGAANGSQSFDGGGDITISTLVAQKFFKASDNILTNFRTVFNGGKNGPFITTFRDDTERTDYVWQYGPGIAFGMGNTNGYLNLRYDTNDIIVGAGNGEKLNWIKHLAFTDGYVANLKNTGTVTLASATEANSIYITAPAYSTDKPVKLLNFQWYEDTWSIGNIRSSDKASNGLGFFNNNLEKLRINSAVRTVLPIYHGVQTSTYLNGNKGMSALNMTGPANIYKTIFSAKSTNGMFTLNAFNANLLLGYTTNTTINAGTNGLTKTLTLFNENGDSSFPGTVSATKFKGNLEGTATVASKLENSRTINGVSFNGTSNITISSNLPVAACLPEKGDDGIEPAYCRVMTVQCDVKWHRISENLLINTRTGSFILNISIQSLDSTKFVEYKVSITTLTNDKPTLAGTGLKSRIMAGIVNVSDTVNRFELWIKGTKWCETVNIYRLSNNGSTHNIVFYAPKYIKDAPSFTTAITVEEYYLSLMNSKLGSYALKSSLSSYATTSSLSNYALKSSLSSYAPKESPVFSGAPKSPTPGTASNDTTIATTAFVQSIKNGANYSFTSANGWTAIKFTTGLLIVCYTNNSITVDFSNASAISDSLYKASKAIGESTYPVAFKTLVYSSPRVKNISSKEAVADIIFTGDAGLTKFPAYTIEAWNVAKSNITVGVSMLFIGTWK